MRQLRTGHKHNFTPTHWLCKKKWIYEKSFMLQIISLSVFMLISSRAGRKEGKCNFWKADYNHQSYVFYGMRWRGCVENQLKFLHVFRSTDWIRSHQFTFPESADIIDFTEPLLLKLIKIAQSWSFEFCLQELIYGVYAALGSGWNFPHFYYELLVSHLHSHLECLTHLSNNKQTRREDGKIDQN